MHKDSIRTLMVFGLFAEVCRITIYFYTHMCVLRRFCVGTQKQYKYNKNDNNSNNNNNNNNNNYNNKNTSMVLQ